MTPSSCRAGPQMPPRQEGSPLPEGQRREPRVCPKHPPKHQSACPASQTCPRDERREKKRIISFIPCSTKIDSQTRREKQNSETSRRSRAVNAGFALPVREQRPATLSSFAKQTISEVWASALGLLGWGVKGGAILADLQACGHPRWPRSPPAGLRLPVLRAVSQLQILREAQLDLAEGLHLLVLNPEDGRHFRIRVWANHSSMGPATQPDKRGPTPGCRSKRLPATLDRAEPKRPLSLQVTTQTLPGPARQLHVKGCGFHLRKAHGHSQCTHSRTRGTRTVVTGRRGLCRQTGERHPALRAVLIGWQGHSSSAAWTGYCTNSARVTSQTRWAL